MIVSHQTLVPEAPNPIERLVVHRPEGIAPATITTTPARIALSTLRKSIIVGALLRLGLAPDGAALSLGLRRRRERGSRRPAISRSS